MATTLGPALYIISYILPMAKASIQQALYIKSTPQGLNATDLTSMGITIKFMISGHGSENRSYINLTLTI